MHRVLLVLYLQACSSSPSATTTATPVAITPDAAVDAAPAPPAPDAELAVAPPLVFRFYSTGLVPPATGPRLETWTLRHVGERGMVLVERMAPDGEAFKPASKTLYLGTASDDGKTLTLALAAGTDKLALACKREKLAIAAATAVRKRHAKGKYKECDPGRWVPEKTKSVDVLQCKHPDFDAPMPFAAAPGVEYLYVNDDCQMQGGGYRAIATDAAIAPVR
ncbi:MAG: hypothetical protein M4D80_05375 [Myxococcota bacterium]|nr:hypothetical protein [Deltaproteobacteria bacterium]MDQ3334568.1 hypothetical protein [Myxococcota bacterium]